MIGFNATVEYLTRQLAVVELHTLAGEWSGSYRVDLARIGGNLHDQGYDRAAQEAALKGGRLEAYREIFVHKSVTVVS